MCQKLIEVGFIGVDVIVDSDNDLGGQNNTSSESSLRKQDRFLPIANMSRIMKKALSANTKISKDAKETVQECVSEFISFVTGEASDKCQREKRKTINRDDMLWAMITLGFEEYVEPLKVYLRKFREVKGDKSSVVVGVTRGGLHVSERDGGGDDGSVVNIVTSGGGYARTGMYGGSGGGRFQSGMFMMGHGHHHGHIYGSGSGASFGQGSKYR
ncbi:hypothetical protein EZV62_004710 [Acer yangbiense]|uniref:Transcription factor CBF/NF-Y/archaeal histone domain-containing protein n=1 Tax=Acer yangbiense TaxID=1000413 RepID=A0A5C7IKS4_9ROSI|nr:hypothetical protein EZV62_004710 [Acer yangbiense]